MDDPRYEPGMPVLDRQAVRAPVLPPSLQGLPPRSVPELRPTPLQRHYISLSVVAVLLKKKTITALEVLFLTTADAALRIWRSAWAWMPVNPGRGLFRLAWFLATLILLVLLGVATWAVLSA